LALGKPAAPKPYPIDAYSDLQYDWPAGNLSCNAAQKSRIKSHDEKHEVSTVNFPNFHLSTVPALKLGISGNSIKVSALFLSQRNQQAQSVSRDTIFITGARVEGSRMGHCGKSWNRRDTSKRLIVARPHGQSNFSSGHFRESDNWLE
jgi:hypothetical protein